MQLNLENWRVRDKDVNNVVNFFREGVYLIFIIFICILSIKMYVYLQVKEKEYQDKIFDDVKDLEKMINK